MQATHPYSSTKLERPERGSAVSSTATPLPVQNDEIEAEEPARHGTCDLTQRVAAALAASTRAEANLRALFRTVKFLGASLGAARETNQHLLSELTALHDALGEGIRPSETPGDRSQRTMQVRASLLEQALSDVTEQSVREREFLIAEHDTFIASLIADHEKEISILRRRVADAECKLASREAEDFDKDWAKD